MKITITTEKHPTIPNMSILQAKSDDGEKVESVFIPITSERRDITELLQFINSAADKTLERIAKGEEFTSKQTVPEYLDIDYAIEKMFIDITSVPGVIDGGVLNLRVRIGEKRPGGHYTISLNPINDSRKIFYKKRLELEVNHYINSVLTQTNNV